jgi:hypothetical protein
MISGTDVMILKIFSPKNWAKNWRILLKLDLVFLRKFDHNIGFREKRKLFLQKIDKNRRKLLS